MNRHVTLLTEFIANNHCTSLLKPYEDFLICCLGKDYTDVKTHKHHILPKFMNGSNEKSNIINLSYDDHQTAHLVLAKCFPTGSRYFSGNIRAANKLNQSVYSKVDLGFYLKQTTMLRATPEYRRKLSEGLMGHAVTKETRNRIRKSKLERPHKLTEEQRNKMIKFRVTQYNLDGTVVNIWITEDSVINSGLSLKSIKACCRGHRYLYLGYVWRNSEDDFYKFPIISLIKDKCDYYVELPNLYYTNGNTVLQFSVDGKLLKEWPTVVYVAKQLGYTPHYIRQCCNGKITNYKEYIWKIKT